MYSGRVQRARVQWACAGGIASGGLCRVLAFSLARLVAREQLYDTRAHSIVLLRDCYSPLPWKLTILPSENFPLSIWTRGPISDFIVLMMNYERMKPGTEKESALDALIATEYS